MNDIIEQVTEVTETESVEALAELPENTAETARETEEPSAPAPATAAAAVDYAALAREDLLAIKSEFPETAGMKDLSELENPLRYGALRDMGLSVREAYLATTTPKSRPLPDNRTHLTSAVPRRSELIHDDLGEEDMQKMRMLFGKLSDREIRKLYKKVNA